MESIALTDAGRVRNNNEDNYYVNGRYKKDTTAFADRYQEQTYSKPCLYAVCDGMGGEALGEEAALLAVESLMRLQNVDSDAQIAAVVQEANRRICIRILENGGRRMGTTLALLSVHPDGWAKAYHMGDSRVYFLRGDMLVQLTQDHTWAQHMVQQGQLLATEVEDHPKRHQLTQHLGIFPEEVGLRLSVTAPIPLHHKDLFLLCSDGLTDMLTSKELCTILTANATLEQKAERLLRIALQNGGIDNITLVLVEAKKQHNASREDA